MSDQFSPGNTGPDPTPGAAAGAAPYAPPTQSPWAAPGSSSHQSTVPAPGGPDQTVPQPAAPQPIEVGTFGTGPAYGPSHGPATVIQNGAAPAPSRRKRRTVVVAAGAVLLLLIGVGAYAGVRVWTGAGIAEPETALPASVGAFARMDFNPGLAAKVDINNLVKKFATGGRSATDLITQLEQNVAKSAGLDYDTDVKPWFSGRIGVAEWTDAAGHPVPLFALSSSDDAVARSTLTRIRSQQTDDPFGFVVRNGYALLSPGGNTQADVTAADTAAAQHPLADADTYKTALSHIGGDNLLVLYTDLDRVGPLLQTFLTRAMGNLHHPGAGSDLGSDFSGLGGLGGLGGLTDGGSTGSGAATLGPFGLLGGLGAIGGLNGLTPSAGSNPFGALHGQIIVGASVESDGVAVRARVLSGGSEFTAPDADQPRALATLGSMPAGTIVGAALVPGATPAGGSAGGSSLQSILPGLLAGGLARGNSQLSGPLSAGLTQLLSAKMIGIAFTGLGAGVPNLIVNVQAKDAAGATSLMSAINQLTGGGSVPDVSIRQNGTTVNATVGQPDTSGKLGASALFEETTSDMSAANAIFYVDVQRAIALHSTGAGSPAPANLAPLKALGFAVGADKLGPTLMIRAVIK